MDDLVFDVGTDNGFVNVAIDLGLFKCDELLNHSEAEEFSDYLQYVAAVIKECAKIVKHDHAEGVKHDNAE
jgi:hypothetical protein